MAPLNRRAWVVQERLLAPRVLHFGSKQILWECHHLDACEMYPRGLPPSLSSIYTGFKGMDPNTEGRRLNNLMADNTDNTYNEYFIWLKVVNQFMRSSLTNLEDKLIAISGIAKQLQPLLQDDYVVGLWRRRLESDLLWTVYHVDAPGTPSKRSLPYRAPSWTWASIDAEIKLIEWGSTEFLISIVDTHIDYVTDDIYGQVANGHIILKGQLVPTIVYRWRFDGSMSMAPNKKTDVAIRFFVPADILPADDDIIKSMVDQQDKLAGYFYALPVLPWGVKGTLYLKGLVLRKSGLSDDSYIRYGSFKCAGTRGIQSLGLLSAEDRQRDSSTIKFI